MRNINIESEIQNLLRGSQIDPSHSNISSIYIAPTANVIDTVNLYNNYKDVLSVGGTGAIGYECILNGAKRVDLFDINYLQKCILNI